MLVAPVTGFAPIGSMARFMVAEAAMNVPQYRTDAELAEDCALILRDSRDAFLRAAAAQLLLGLAVSRPHDPREATG